MTNTMRDAGFEIATNLVSGIPYQYLILLNLYFQFGAVIENKRRYAM